VTHRLSGEYHEDFWLRSVRELAGAGRDLFRGVDPDEYVDRLRRDWD
jgi:hypothetical protein